MHHLRCTIPTSEVTLMRRVEEKIPMDIVEDIFKVLTTFLPLNTTIMATVEAFYVYMKYEPPATEALHSWGDWAGKFAALERLDELGNLAKDIQEFGRDLETLHTLWGSTHVTSPEAIWEDITAFTPSKFFAVTKASAVTKLVPIAPRHEELSENPLSTISAVAANGHELGVLSIWPPCTYENWSKNLLPKNHVSDLREICSGWIARFEIWTTEEIPICRTNLEIPLNENEIRLQMCQSLSRYMTPSFSCPPDTEWKLQFPLEISRDLRIVVVLRTVVFLKTPATHSDNLKPEYAVTTVPMLSSGSTSDRWSDRACDLNGCLINQMHGAYKSAYYGLYQYFFLISPDNQFLFFADADHNSRNRFKLGGIVAVYHLRPECSYQIALTDSFHVQNSHIRPQNVAFHPKVPFVSFISDSDIFMWAFGCKIGKNYSSTNHKVEDFRGIYFSECGTQLGLIGPRLSMPIVVAVEPQDIFQTAKRLRDRFSPSRTPGNSQAISEHLEQGEIVVGRLPEAGAKFAVWLDQMNELCYENYKSKSSSSKPPPQSVQRRRLDITGDYLSVQNLTRLPGLTGLDATHATVIDQDSRDDRFTIVLNKVARHWSGMSDEKNSQLPLMVSKDKRALQQPTREPIQVATKTPLTLNYSANFS